MFEVVSNLSTTFTLPIVFSERTNTVDIQNLGDVDSPCVLEIVFEESKTDATIKVENVTTEKSITIECDVTVGEVITVDTEKSTITSSVQGNIMKFITADSDFFLLKKGLNSIEVTCDAILVISATYRYRYLGV